jgi:hypothetical protein
MASIYLQAQMVLVWLGRAEYNDFMTTLGSLGKEWKRIVSGLDDHNDPRGYVSLEFAKATSNRWVRKLVKDCEPKDVVEFFGKPWFRRVWVLQEWLLARNVTIFAGHDSISFELFKHAIDALQHYKHLLPRATIEGPASDHLHSLSIVADMVNSRRLYPWKTKKSLYQCCRMMIKRECTNEHDKIYAVLGLAENDYSIRPEYDPSLAEVCLDMSRKSLLAGDFSILHHADTSQTPSFVVRLHDRHEQARPLALDGSGIARYRAGLSRQPCIRPFNTNSVKIKLLQKQIDDSEVQERARL